MHMYMYMYMCKCTHYTVYMYMYMKIHVPSILAKGVEAIKKQKKTTKKQPQWFRKLIKYSHKGFRKY